MTGAVGIGIHEASVGLVLTRSVSRTPWMVQLSIQATCAMNDTPRDNYAKQANYLWVDDVMKYCVIICISIFSQNIKWPE